MKLLGLHKIWKTLNLHCEICDEATDESYNQSHHIKQTLKPSIWMYALKQL